MHGRNSGIISIKLNNLRSERILIGMGTSGNAISRRTTITLSPESQQIVEMFKDASGTSTSGAINRIIEASQPKPSRLKEVNGFLVLDTPRNRNGRKIHVSIEKLKRAEDEIDREYVERLWRPARTTGTRAQKTRTR